MIPQKLRPATKRAALRLVIIALGLPIAAACTSIENRKKTAQQKRSSKAKKNKKSLPHPKKTRVSQSPPNETQSLGKRPAKNKDGSRLEDLAKLSSLKEQERKALAQHYFHSGQNHFNALRYRKAASDLDLSLQADKTNLKVKQLYEKTLWILGDRRGEIHDMARELADTRVVAIRQAQIEIDRLYREGELLLSKEKYSAAVERFERVLEAIRWFPYNIDSGNLKSRAEDQINRAQKLRDKQMIRYRQLRNQAAQQNALAEKNKKILYEKSRLRALYRRAMESYRTERFARTEEICNEILEQDPTDLNSSRLRRAAIELRHRKQAKDTYNLKLEHLKRQLEWIEESAVPYQSIFRFPNKEEWQEIAKRNIQFTYSFEKKAKNTESIQIKRALSIRRIDLNFEGTPFTDCVNFLRDITGLNFVISKEAEEAISDDKEISLRLKQITLKNALELMLSQLGGELDYSIRDGAIVLTTSEENKAELFLEFYEVSSIIKNINDYPGPEVGLSQGNSGQGNTGPSFDLGGDDDDDEPKGGIGAEKLIELIEQVQGDSEEGSLEVSGGVLIVRKPAAIHRKIIKLLEALRRAVGIMVTVEARFLQIQDNFLESIGLDLTGLPQSIFGPRGSAFAPSSAGFNFIDAQGQTNVRANMINLLSSTIGNGAGNPFNIVTSGGGAFQYNVLTDQFQLQAILEAVKKRQKARMVSSPRLTVFNGQRAHFLSINQRAYIEDVEVNQTGVIPVLNPVIGILNTGAILDVRPTVSYDRKYVTMEVRPTLAQQTGTRSSIVTLAGGNTSIPIELPTIVVQKIRTNVTVPDGGSVLIGGMKNLQSQYNETSVPIFGRVPILKNFFRRQGSASLKSSQVVLIKAKITILRELEEAKFGQSN